MLGRLVVIRRFIAKNGLLVPSSKQYAVTRGLVAGADSSIVIECAMRHFTGLAN
jgi:hypothetical protein